jgi:hypothetical protein
MTCQEFWNAIAEPGGVETERHVAECSACAARMNRHRELEAGLYAVAAADRRMEAPTRVEARLRAAFRRQTESDGRAPSRRWVPVVTWAAGIAATFALAVFLVRGGQPEAVQTTAHPSIELALVEQTDADGFIPLPNSAGLTADGDDVNLVRVAVPRSAMMALGLDVSADRAEELVEADVMLGSNGIARAVRFLD